MRGKLVVLAVMATTVLIALTSCNTAKIEDSPDDAFAKAHHKDTVRIANDSLAYEVIIIEPGFQGWLVTQPPRGYYSQNYLERFNNLYVREYNLRVQNTTGSNADLYVFRIDYDREIDYGYEVNYLLYNYFIFFEDRYNQQLVPRGRQ
jgi:hypothetical protein